MTSWLALAIGAATSIVSASIVFGVMKSTVDHLKEAVAELRGETKQLRLELVDVRLRVAEDTGTHRLPGPRR